MARQREHRSGLKSRHNVLTDLQNKREGVSEAVRGILKSREKGEGFAYVKGIVADLISTDMENASVIEEALGDLQNAVIVTDSGGTAGGSRTLGQDCRARHGSGDGSDDRVAGSGNALRMEYRLQPVGRRRSQDRTPACGRTG